MPVMIRRIVKVFWRTCALLLIGLAVLVQAGRELSPLVSEQRVWFEQRLSQAIGAQVTLDYISVDWVGLLPTLRVGNFLISSNDDPLQKPLQIRDGVIQLDLSETFWQRQLIWKQLTLTGVNLSLQQTDIGTWGLQGLVFKVGTSSGWFSDLDPLNMLLKSGQAELRENAINLHFNDGRSSHLRLPEILLENDGTDFHRIKAFLSVDGVEQSLTFIAEGEGDPRRRTFVGQGYLQLQSFPVDRFLHALPHASDQLAFVLKADGQAQLDMSVWLDWRKNHRIGMVGQLGLSSEGAQLESGLTLPSRLEAVVSGSWQSLDRWQLDINQLASTWGDSNLSNFTARIARTPAEWRGYLPEVDTAIWLRWLQNSQILATDKGRVVADVLNTLNPVGYLRQMRVIVPERDWHDLTIKADVDQLAVDSWRGAPALNGVNGYLESGIYQGFIALDSDSGFSMHYPSVYSEPLDYNRATGTIGWSLQPDNNAVYVYSSTLSLDGDDGHASGVFKLFLPWQKNTLASDLSLQIGLSDSEARYHKKYVPTLVDESLSRWLDDSIVSGTIKEAGFLYRGRLTGEASERDFQVFVDLEKGRLKYHPDWPVVTDIKAELTVDNGLVNTVIESGKIYNTLIEQGALALSPNADGGGSLLTISAAVNGPAADGFAILRDNVLGAMTGGGDSVPENTASENSGIGSWDLQGQLQGTIDLSVPLSSGAPGHRQYISVALNEATLNMQDLNLEFSHLSGGLEYSNDKGLLAKELVAELWGRPVKTVISSKPYKGKLNAHDIVVSANSALSSGQIAEWARRPELLFIDGDIPINARVKIPADPASAGYNAQVVVESDLHGAEVQLPDVLAKKADVKIPVRLTVPVQNGLTRYELSYGSLLNGVFEQREGKLTNGVLTFGEPALLPVDPQILITGKLGQVDLTQWQEALVRYQEFSRSIADSLVAQNLSESELNAVSRDLKLAVDLRIDQAQFKDLQLDNLTVSGKEVGDAWHLQLQSSVLAGVVVWQPENPLQVDLDYLRLPAAASKKALVSNVGPENSDIILNSDSLADIDLAALTDINFSTEEFMLGNEPYGRWAFKLRNYSQPQGYEQIEVSDISAFVRGTTIMGKPVDGAESETGAKFIWRRTEAGMESAFQGRILASGMQDVLAAWHQPPMLKSEKAIFDADWRWQGSPAAISLLGLEGSLLMDIQRGAFVKGAEAGSNPLLRLMGLFNFDSLARRLKLDFSDLYNEGMAFDKIQGELLFNAGSVQLAQPVVAKTPSTRLQLGGAIDLKNETLDTRLVATLPVGGNLTLITALAGGLPVAAGVYVASKLFESQVDKVASVSYSIRGDWNNPAVQFEKLFDRDAAKDAGRNSAVTADELRKDAADTSDDATESNDTSTNPVLAPDTNVPAMDEDNGVTESVEEQ